MSNNDVLGERQDHESYGMLGFDRVTCSGAQPLFGSSIKHRDTIMMTLKTGHMRRNLNEDWYYGDKTIVQVEMSATQFADLITSLNQGDGVPVTIRVRPEDIKLHRCENPPYIDRNQLHREELKEDLDDCFETSKQLIKVLADKFATKKTFNKKDQQEILDMLKKIQNNLGCNQTFAIDQFDRQMQRSTTEAKGEIEAFFQNKLNQIAQQALVENPESITSLESPVLLDETPRPKLKRKE